MTQASDNAGNIRVLIAEDDALTRKALSDLASKWGYDPVSVSDGLEAWQMLSAMVDPCVAIIDRRMPGVDGCEICRRVRSSDFSARIYIIMLTGMQGRGEIVEGLRSGADDYVTKPFEEEELHVRVDIGGRLVTLQTDLARRIVELKTATAHIQQLQGLLPICAKCKCIRDTENYWHQVEHYMSKHAELKFTHSLCPVCANEMLRDAGLEPII